MKRFLIMTDPVSSPTPKDMVSYILQNLKDIKSDALIGHLLQISELAIFSRNPPQIFKSENHALKHYD
jgi:hypothetical protein